MRIAYAATDDVRAALARIGRTEDIDFSPSGQRLALAGFRRDYLLILDVMAEGAAVALTGALEIDSPVFKSPHGLCWLDDGTLIVGNRFGDISVFELPEDRREGRIALDPVGSIGADPADLTETPGSLAATHIGLGLIEVLVCNNFAHYVTQHLLDARNGYTPVASMIIATDGLALPDGIARSQSGRWLAISNHDDESVLIFEDDGRTHLFRQPAAVLRGIRFPHGLVFAPDERALLVADAGTRFVHLFASKGGRWSGEHKPQVSIEVLDEALFKARGRALCDRGPKGVALTPNGRLLATTCENLPLAFFDLQGLVNASDEAAIADARAEPERARAALLGQLAAARIGVDETTRALRQAGDRTLQAMRGSRSWRYTAPLRRLRTALRRPR